MTFWKILWHNQNNIKELQKKKDNLENHILIQNFHHNSQYINIFFSNNKNINLYALEQLCDRVGWVRRPIKKVKTAIENSFLTASLYYNDKQKKELIAFARATSDNTFNATIWDVVVHPEFQKKGLGKLLINEVIKQLRSCDINTITLFADPQIGRAHV